MLMKSSFYVREALWSPALCDEAIRFGEELEAEDAVVEGSVDPDKSLRSSKVSWIPENNETTHLYTQIRNAVAAANYAEWGFHIRNPEEIQYTKYEKNDYYTWHRDTLNSPHENQRWPGQIRKLSAVIALDDGSEYGGGDFCLEVLDEGPTAVMFDDPRVKHVRQLRTRGTVVVFPAFLYHRVTTVTHGTRRSLVVWFQGPPFV